MKNFSTALLALAVVFVAIGCDTRPKVYNNRLDLSSATSTDTSTVVDTFGFNFAYRDASATSPLNQIVFLQGNSVSKSTIISTCNGAGTNCVCSFYDSSHALLQESSSTQITYDSTGNYIRCQYTGALGSLAYVKVRNQNSSRVSIEYPVDLSLTLQKLIGVGNDVNKVRTVSRYGCLFNFLQKAGTTTLLFDCSSQNSLCWSGFSNNAGETSGDFCLLQSTFPFYLYTSGYDNNFDKKIADKIYGGDTAAGNLCGFQVKQYDCTGTAGTPVKSFGIYTDQIGIFQYPLSLTPAPEQAVAVYGFAAATSTFMGSTVCPPGMVRRIFYATSTAGISSVGPSHNFPDTLTATEIVAPTSPPVTGLEVNKVGGGDCKGTACSAPLTAIAGTVRTFNYSNSGQTEFCVIDPNLLPN